MTPQTFGTDLQEYDLVCRARDGGEALYALAAMIGRMYLADTSGGDRHLLGGIAATLRILGSAELQLAHEWEELRRHRGRAEPPAVSSSEGGDA
jgi:hypothetical protein